MTRLNDNTVERLKGLDIKDVADRLGIELPRGNGNARCFNQEAHANGDRHGSLGFNPRTNTFKCFACGISGDTIALVMAYNKVDFRGACEWLANSYGIQLEGVEQRANKEKKPDFENRRVYRDDTEPLRLSNSLTDYEVENQEIYQALYDLSDEPSDQLKRWWASRGFSNSLLQAYGWRTVSPNTIKELLQAYDYPLLAKAGLVSDDRAELERFLKRYNTHNVIVPFYDETLFKKHRVLYVRFRDLTKGAKIKYLAPTGSHPVIYGYDRLCGWAMTYPKPNALYITESETDSIAVTELAKRQGKTVQAIALVGGQKNEHSLVLRELAEAIKNHKEATVNIVTDRDETGNTFYNAVATTLYKTGFNPDNLIKWQEWHETLKDVGEHLQRLAEQPNGQQPNNNVNSKGK